MEGNGNTTFSVPMAPAGYGGDMFGGGMNGIWGVIILLAVLGYGNGGILGGGRGYGGEIQRGFDQNAVMNGISAIQTTQDTNQMALMQQFFNMLSQFQNCCCENRAGIADLKYTVATEACADRTAVSNALRDVIASNTANTQAILDKLCQQEIDALKTQNANLQTQVNMMNLAQSQTAQTAKILADNAAQTQALEQYLNPVPIPAYVVQNPNCCTNSVFNGCGCNA